MEASRYHLVEVAPGGLLLDLRSGAIVSLNSSATAVWKQHLTGLGRDSIAQTIASRYQISEEQARRDVETALDVGGKTLPPPPAGEYQYERSSGGYSLSRSGEPVIQIDDEARFLSWCHSSRPTVAYARSLLQSVAPRIMSRRGQTVLHSSAALIGDAVIAFSGHSGAGKTTTAQSLVDSGAVLVSEDKLVLRIGIDRVDVVLSAEAAMQSWARVAADEVVAGRPAGCDALGFAAVGPVAPLREVGFIDLDRRKGGRIAAEPFTRLQAAWALYYNAFHGSAAPDDWKKQLETCATMAGHVTAYQLTTPDSLSLLAGATQEIARRGSLRA